LQPREKQFNYEKFGAGYYVVAWATAFFRFNVITPISSGFGRSSGKIQPSLSVLAKLPVSKPNPTGISPWLPSAFSKLTVLAV
ncbi:MAG: hypothetical protein KZQ70_13630, partial [gamma proteobacterium symbiont of Lucinoma myriamae]|nr:hypothetical protein [gamma proteobacterium symbiont of Lucinoma myriamae]MCU7819821.1 hypothetical protein [gamma proteobacterium symbiont of Lucinoma myriamae]MCU7833355.1 hypothetical protein [gamma proteobacterium symbiont of Lucinoma myriamae]